MDKRKREDHCMSAPSWDSYQDDLPPLSWCEDHSICGPLTIVYVLANRVSYFAKLYNAAIWPGAEDEQRGHLIPYAAATAETSGRVNKSRYPLSIDRPIYVSATALGSPTLFNVST